MLLLPASVANMQPRACGQGDRTLEFGIGGAVKLGHPSDPSYRYVIDGLIVYF